MANELDREELIKFLKENLKIKVESNNSTNYYTNSVCHTIHLVLGDEVISTDYIDTY